MYLTRERVCSIRQIWCERTKKLPVLPLLFDFVKRPPSLKSPLSFMSPLDCQKLDKPQGLLNWNTLPLSVLLHRWLPLFYRFLDLGSLREVDLSGVATANNNHKDAQAKGIKAFFNMDDSGILNLDKVWQRFFYIYIYIT